MSPSNTVTAGQGKEFLILPQIKPSTAVCLGRKLFFALIADYWLGQTEAWWA